MQGLFLSARKIIISVTFWWHTRSFLSSLTLSFHSTTNIKNFCRFLYWNNPLSEYYFTLVESKSSISNNHIHLFSKFPHRHYYLLVPSITTVVRTRVLDEGCWLGSLQSCQNDQDTQSDRKSFTAILLISWHYSKNIFMSEKRFWPMMMMTLPEKKLDGFLCLFLY